MMKNYDNVLLKWDFNIDLIDKRKDTNNQFSDLYLLIDQKVFIVIVL